MMSNQDPTSKALQVLRKTLAWSAAQDFRGYNKHDGLNSPILKAFCNWGKWPRICAIQAVMRAPINIRPLLLSPKTYNPKGLALFIQSYLALYQCHGQTQDLERAKQLVAILQQQVSPGNWAGNCWGYHYPWRDLGFFAPANSPNAVVSCFVCEALLDYYSITRDQGVLTMVESCIRFFLGDLARLHESDEELCLAYIPDHSIRIRVMDVSMLIGSVIARYCRASGHEGELKTAAEKLVRYVVRQQTPEGAWFYTDPPSDSHITHDNYHTGFILDALLRFMSCFPEYNNYQAVYDKGLAFYAQHLFNSDGSPRWMHNKDFPHDIHGAAQGIITFSRHQQEYPGLADKVLNWTLNTLYHPEGRFYYQESQMFHQKYIKRFTLLRWCNAWMCRALGDYLMHQKGESSHISQ